MVTYKFEFSSDKCLLPVLKEGNKIVRIAFNLFKQGYDSVNVERLIKSKYKYDSGLLDASLVKTFCQEADMIFKSFKTRKSKSLIFGSKKKWKEFIDKKISKDEWNTVRNTQPLFFSGDKNCKYGNRKFNLDIENGFIVFKLNRNNHYKLKINFGGRRDNLMKIQSLTESRLVPVSYKLSDKHIYIMFDEIHLKTSEHKFVSDRVAGLDLNPNYIAFSICDKNEIVYKEIVDLTKLNDTHNKNKKDYEIIEIAKRLSLLCKHYQVEMVGYEELNMSSKNHHKGKSLNRLINNSWNRNLFVNNFRKRLNILGIKNHSIVAQYSSTIGCLNHPNEVDSIAASLEIARRTFVYKKKFLDKDKDFLDKDIIYPSLDVNKLKEKWNSILSDYHLTKGGWKSIHEYLKKQKKLTQLRCLFKDYNFSLWSFLRNKSRKSLTCSYFSM